MPRFVRIFLELAILGACISLSIALQDRFPAQIVRAGAYAVMGLLVCEWLLVAVPKLPGIASWIFAARFRHARLSIGMVLCGVAAYFLTRYGYDPVWGGWVTFAIFPAAGWPLLEIIAWISGIGLDATPPPPAEPMKAQLPPYIPDPLGDIEKGDGLALFRDFINTLDGPSSDNKEV